MKISRSHLAARWGYRLYLAVTTSAEARDEEVRTASAGLRDRVGRGKIDEDDAVFFLELCALADSGNYLEAKRRLEAVGVDKWG